MPYYPKRSVCYSRIVGACHPERSEGSLVRFFVSRGFLRMT